MKNAKTRLKRVPHTRDGLRFVKDLLEVYKAAVKRLERVARRTHDQQEGKPVSLFVTRFSVLLLSL